ncbi:MAG: 4-(cytidine 5'-diphospho)-2-C-methyl-D-erythritol kinase [Lachnospiraceae bacterium]|nr:4-(cytidine 5'-diphospho)-2-C-methyl-D-erythritol kinase [Lachnospiraceae bacterium]
MREMTRKARAKINLGLDVIGRFPNGYHDLRMVMQTVDLCDELILRASDEGGDGSIRLLLKQDTSVSSGEELIPADESNLACRAARMLMDEFGVRKDLEIVLKKQIPAAAGLAGGSADAAAVFKGVNELFALGLGEQELRERGVKIGADVPYCIMGGTALAEGIGERLTRLPDAPQAYVLLVKPPICVSTKYVYSSLDSLDSFDLREANSDGRSVLPLAGRHPTLRAGYPPTAGRGRFRDGQIVFHPDIDGEVQAIRGGDFSRMAALMGNVLESVTIPAFPVVGEIKERMLIRGAVNAMMSGSGPTVFGLFDDRGKAERAYADFSGEESLNEVFLTTFWP